LKKILFDNNARPWTRYKDDERINSEINLRRWWNCHT